MMKIPIPPSENVHDAMINSEPHFYKLHLEDINYSKEFQSLPFPRGIIIATSTVNPASRQRKTFDQVREFQNKIQNHHVTKSFCVIAAIVL